MQGSRRSVERGFWSRHAEHSAVMVISSSLDEEVIEVRLRVVGRAVEEEEVTCRAGGISDMMI